MSDPTDTTPGLPQLNQPAGQAPDADNPFLVRLLAVLALMSMTAAGFLYIGTRLATGADLPEEEMKILDMVYNQVDKEYVRKLSEDEKELLIHRAISGMVRGLDRYSSYIPPDDVNEFDAGNRGVYHGIGVLMQPKGDVITVYFPFPDGPAERAGLRVGDRLVAVTTLDEQDGDWVATKTTRVSELVRDISNESQRYSHLLQDVRKLVIGPTGTPVRLQVERVGKEPFWVTIERGEVRRPSVKWARFLDADADLAYLHLNGFVHRSVEEFDNTIRMLEQESGRKIRGLIVDLRFNKGGGLIQCCELTNRFLKEGVIVTLNKDKNNDNGRVIATHTAKPDLCTLPDLPLVILINGASASASEVFTGALQDHGRAVVVGTRSYGKGLVQSIYSWPRKELDFRLKITTSEYRTPKGRNIQRQPGAKIWGIDPDVLVPATDKNTVQLGLSAHEVPRQYRRETHALAQRLEIEVAGIVPPAKDPQLERALGELRKLVQKRKPAGKNGR